MYTIDLPGLGQCGRPSGRAPFTSDAARAAYILTSLTGIPPTDVLYRHVHPEVAGTAYEGRLASALGWVPEALRTTARREGVLLTLSHDARGEGLLSVFVQYHQMEAAVTASAVGIRMSPERAEMEAAALAFWLEIIRGELSPAALVAPRLVLLEGYASPAPGELVEVAGPARAMGARVTVAGMERVASAVLYGEGVGDLVGWESEFYSALRVV